MYYNMYNVMYVLFKNCIIRCIITSIHAISPSVLYSHSKMGVRGHAPEGPVRVSGPGGTVTIFLLLFHSIKETVFRQDRVVSIT